MFYELLLAITTEPLPSLFQLVPSSPPMAFGGEGGGTVKNIEYYAVIIGGIKRENLHYLSRDFSQDFLDIYKRLITSKTHLYIIP